MFTEDENPESNRGNGYQECHEQKIGRPGALEDLEVKDVGVLSRMIA